MKDKFSKKSKSYITLFIVFSLFALLIAPLKTNYVEAQKEQNSTSEEVEMSEDFVQQNKSSQENSSITEKEKSIENTELTEEDLLTEDNLTNIDNDNANKPIIEPFDSIELKDKNDSDKLFEEDNEEKKRDNKLNSAIDEVTSEQTPSESTSTVHQDEERIPQDLGNIFILNSFKINGQEANPQQVVEITDNTTVNLDYQWNTENIKAENGDFATINVPQAFRFEDKQEFEEKDIIVQDTDNKPLKVGVYSLQNNQIKLIFNNEIEKGHIKNGILGFSLKFNKEKFKVDVVEEIEFKDSANKKFTIIGKPNTSVSSISKTGFLESTQDGQEIKWIIDVTNASKQSLMDSKVIDNIPKGLELIPESVQITNLTVGLDGNLNLGEKSSLTPIITKEKLEHIFDEISAYKGYRIEFVTAIADLNQKAFTNQANLTYQNNTLIAEATVELQKSNSSIEKYGTTTTQKDTISWWIDVNKSRGTVEEAVIKEDLPDGLTVTTRENAGLIDKGIALYKLNNDGKNWVPEKKPEIIYKEFPINLGKLEADDNYRLIFETQIDYSKINNGEYQKKNTFINTAKLFDGNAYLSESQKEVRIWREKILSKFGSTRDLDYTNKIKWGINLNEATHSLKNIVVEDYVPEGLKVTKENIKIYRYDTGNSRKKDVTSEFKEITVTSAANNRTKITVNFGNIDQRYLIEYYTQITDMSKHGEHGFQNLVHVSGNGLGIGSGEYLKDAAWGSVPENSYHKFYKDIDYNQKHIDWEIVLDPKREPIKELTIQDVFTFKGLELLKDTLEIKIGGNKITKANYDIVSNQASPADGFEIRFKMDKILPTINNQLSVTFKTSFDPDQLDYADYIDNDYLYENTARFFGKTDNKKEFDVTKTAEVEVLPESWASGKKIGKLISIDQNGKMIDGWQSGNERKIQWEVYTNYGNKNLGTGVRLKDTLDYEGKIDQSSIQIKEYTVNKNGTTNLTETLLDPSKYEVEFSENDKKLLIRFTENFNKRYVVLFKTSVPDVSKKTYTNNALLTVGQKEYPYTGSVDFDQADEHISKETLQTDKNVVYTDDEVQWQVNINKSLSNIKEEVTILDTLSTGLTYKKNSLKIYKIIGQKRVLVNDGYALKVANNNNSNVGTTLEIKFPQGMNSAYEIEYITVVTGTGGTVSNKVDYSWEDQVIKSVETSQMTVKQTSYIGGDFYKKGAIKIIKADTFGNTISDDETIFEIMYQLNNKKIPLGTHHGKFTTKSGVLELKNLVVNRTYFIQEVQAPAGYIKDNQTIEVNLTSQNNSYEKNFVNRKIPWSLPATGGTGTSIFIITGLVLMIVTSHLLVKRRKH